MKTILVVGSRGQLARSIVAVATPGYQCVGRERAELDITDGLAVNRALAEVAPAMVINGAAYNLVDKAEDEGMEDALRVNALGVGRLARACREAGVPLVHFSTDFVFDGAKGQPYTETDCPAPLGIYGVSKLAGENIALAASPSNYVIRVERLFGPIDGERTQKPGGNFPLLMLKLGRERDCLRVVNDQIGSPSYTRDLAVGIWELIERAPGGLYHLSNAGEVAFDEYARETLRLGGVSCTVEGVRSGEYAAPARRPLYSTLDNAKAVRAGVRPLRHWREALAEFVREL